MRPHKLRSWAGVAQDNIAVTDDHLCITFLCSRAARATLNQGDIDYDVSRAKVGRGREEDVPVSRPRDRD